MFPTIRPSRVTIAVAAAAAGLALTGGGAAFAASTAATHHLNMSHSAGKVPGAPVPAPTGSPAAPGQMTPIPAPTGSPGAAGQVPAGSAAGSGYTG